MSLLQKGVGALALLVLAVLGILLLVYNERIFGWLQPFAEKWKHTTGGWVILWGIIFVIALPPMVGYSACATTAGFVYGMWKGWLILATATVAGSFVSFLVSRTILRRYVERLVETDNRFAALTLTLKSDGLRLLCMIRFCPLPYSLSNGALSTFPTVHPAMFALATTIVTPKLFVHVFIGSRLAAIAKNGGEMSFGDRAINYVSIVISMTVGIFTGWYIYQKTLVRARQLEEEERSGIRDATQRLSAPRQYMDDPEALAATTTIAYDEAEEVDLNYFDHDLRADDATYRHHHDSEADFRQADGPVVELAGGLNMNR